MIDLTQLPWTAIAGLLAAGLSLGGCAQYLTNAANEIDKRRAKIKEDVKYLRAEYRGIRQGAGDLADQYRGIREELQDRDLPENLEKRLITVDQHATKAWQRMKELDNRLVELDKRLQEADEDLDTLTDKLREARQVRKDLVKSIRDLATASRAVADVIS